MIEEFDRKCALADGWKAGSMLNYANSIEDMFRVCMKMGWYYKIEFDPSIKNDKPWAVIHPNARWEAGYCAENDNPTQALMKAMMEAFENE